MFITPLFMGSRERGGGTKRITQLLQENAQPTTLAINMKRLARKEL
jgi:hypothetical protein